MAPTELPKNQADCLAFLDRLERGELRAADRDEAGNWHANAYVKQSILQIFRLCDNAESRTGVFCFRDRAWIPPIAQVPSGVRVVPGGTTIRRGAYVGSDVIVMPPAYINIGAYVDRGSLIDSHALVGSCAQVGKNVHVSAAAQIGGVLEPVGALPIIVEDDAFIGGNTGLYDGVIVRRRAVIAAGVVLTASSVLYDLVKEQEIRAVEGRLVVPEAAVVVPGARPAKGDFACKLGLSLAAPMIVKYRDENTNARTALEGALR